MKVVCETGKIYISSQAVVRDLSKVTHIIPRVWTNYYRSTINYTVKKKERGSEINISKCTVLVSRMQDIHISSRSCEHAVRHYVRSYGRLRTPLHSYF